MSDLRSLLAAQAAPAPAPGATPKPGGSPANDPGFQAWFKQHEPAPGQWDPVDDNGISGGYKLYRAYQLGLTPGPGGHLPDKHPGTGETLKTDADTNAVTNGIDNRTGYQVAPPTYTGPMTPDIIKNAAQYFRAGTAVRKGGPNDWDDIPTGKTAPAKTVPLNYKLTATK